MYRGAQVKPQLSAIPYPTWNFMMSLALAPPGSTNFG